MNNKYMSVRMLLKIMVRKKNIFEVLLGSIRKELFRFVGKYLNAIC